MNPDTMTVDECRDWLRDKYWKKIPTWKGFQYLRIGTANQQEHDPIPATLDEAAKLPDGWEYEIHNRNVGGYVCVRAIPLTGHWDTAISGGGETELLARFRLRVKIELAGGAR